MCCAVHAQTDVHDFDAGSTLPAPLLSESPVQADADSQGDAVVPALADRAPQSSASHMAQQIERSIKARQWAQLHVLLSDYAAHPQADLYLVYYAQGALYRQQKNYRAAIAAFAALLRAQPQLVYVRLDLAMMQIEDKQYAAAMTTLDGLVNNPQMPEALRQLARAHQQRLRAVYAPELTLTANMARNNNVNQASSDRVISLGGVDFVKAQDSLPKVGHGVHYGVGVRKLLPVQGRHAVSLGAQYRGVHYYDQKDYSERTLRLTPFYLYQSYPLWFKFGPVYEKNWLGGQRYGSRLGMQAEWGWRWSDKNHLMPAFEYTRKRYDPSRLYRYEGANYRSAVTWLHQISSGKTLWLGASHLRDVLHDKPESSTTMSLRAGGTLRMNNGLTLQASVQAGQRRFDAPHALFRVTRRDREQYASISLSHSKLSFWGITPRLTYTWRSVRSNIPALYSRSSRGVMLETVEWVF